ncbi:hypothetical protein [Streptomyces sp. NBC_01800]|uniref:hypothetical protein n=1 Tax=Streptomyces sp. NBC_01800 TaxID=2975945 RepID=UPI003FA35296
MSETPMHEAGDVREAWGRVTAWLERYDPEALAGLGGPGSHAAISEAELHMGLKLPGEMWQWLLANDIDAGRQPDGQSCLVALGCEVAVPGGHLLLGLTDIQRVYLSRMALEEMQPSADLDYPCWRREWVPIAAERDGLYGTFLDTLDRTVGTWAEAYGPEEGVYASLFLSSKRQRTGWKGSLRESGEAPASLLDPVSSIPVRKTSRYASGHAPMAIS